MVSRRKLGSLRVWVPRTLLEELNRLIAEAGYVSRAEAVRRGIRLVIEEAKSAYSEGFTE